MSHNQITKGSKVKDALGRWATVLDIRDNVLIVDKFWRFVHIDNVIEVR